MTTSARIDHILAFANVNNIDEYVSEYRTRGFFVDDATYRYKPGLRNRFISLGCEYIELVWVENEEAFAAGGTEEFGRMFPNLPSLRKVPHPFSIGFQTPDVESLHDTWTNRGYVLPPVWSFAPPGMPPILSFQVIPDMLLPGISGFAITYHSTVEGQARHIKVAPNSIYALEGLTLVSATPERNAAKWRDLLVPDTAIQDHDGVFTITVSAHKIHWITPEQYRTRYGLVWLQAPHDSGDIAALHLLASDIDKATTMLGKGAGPSHDPQVLVIPPDPCDGLTFMIREYPVERWVNERMALTGERIEVQ
jgi:hypothetical protein